MGASFEAMAAGDERTVIEQPVELPVERPIWDRFYAVFPLVIVGTKEGPGFDLAPKHMAMPLGWENHFCFVCSPRHRTYRNLVAERAFTVSYPRPSEVLLASLAAAPRWDDGTKPALAAIPTVAARAVEGVVVADSYVWLECRLREIIDGFGTNSLIIGDIVAAAAHEDVLVDAERDAAEQIFAHPLLAYVSPGRIAAIRQSTAFPFHKGWSR